MKLSKHFSLKEVIKSETAVRKGIDNTPTEQIKHQLKAICETIMEPIRVHYGKPIRVTSGYRCIELNKRFGGSNTSQHIFGQAVDIRVPNLTTAELYNYIYDSLNILNRYYSEKIIKQFNLFEEKKNLLLK